MAGQKGKLNKIPHLGPSGEAGVAFGAPGPPVWGNPIPRLVGWWESPCTASVPQPSPRHLCALKGHEDPFCSRQVETRALGRSVSWGKMCGQCGRSDPTLHGSQAVSQPLLRVSGSPQGGRESLVFKWGSFGKIGVVREKKTGFGSGGMRYVF